MKTHKLDKRHLGFGVYKFAADFNYKELEKFCEIRAWCWSQWGSSCEVDTVIKVFPNPPVWAWIKDDFRTKIYFQTEKEFQWFTLKWR